MPYHHLALAVHDMQAIHDFYTESMGFELVKVEMAATPTGGRAKHYFYDTGNGEFMAFWDLRDPNLPSEFPTSMSGAAGLPPWTNHLAFKADSVEHAQAIRDRWLARGHRVMEIDHHWCYSVYTNDPNGTMVEFCTTTGTFTAADRERALAALTRDDLELDAPPNVTMHDPEATAAG